MPVDQSLTLTTESSPGKADQGGPGDDGADPIGPETLSPARQRLPGVRRQAAQVQSPIGGTGRN